MFKKVKAIFKNNFLVSLLIVALVFVLSGIIGTCYELRSINFWESFASLNLNSLNGWVQMIILMLCLLLFIIIQLIFYGVAGVMLTFCLVLLSLIIEDYLYNLLKTAIDYLKIPGVS